MALGASYGGSSLWTRSPYQWITKQIREEITFDDGTFYCWEVTDGYIFYVDDGYVSANLPAYKFYSGTNSTAHYKDTDIRRYGMVP